MEALTMLVLVGVLVCAGELIGSRFRLPVPVIQLLLGVVVGFIPLVRTIQLPSEAVLVLFLPALLFWESLGTPLREIRRALRGVVLLGTALVVATSLAVGGVGVALGLGWGTALLLGAALAPTDATAVAGMSKRLPHQQQIVLRAESLINDGSALVVFAVAVGITINQTKFTPMSMGWLVILAYVGGAAVGWGVAWLSGQILKVVKDPLRSNIVLLIAPFLAFLLSELIGGSGVIAVVVTGLVMSQIGPRVSTPASRELSGGFWSLTTTMLNGGLFVLIGIEVQTAVRAVSAKEIPWLLLLTVAVWITILVVRLIFQFLSAYAIRALDRRPSQLLRRIPHKFRFISAAAGFRGAVSLAVALAVPVTLANGQEFQGRNQIVFVACGVVLLSLLVQSAMLSTIIRWARIPTDTMLTDELLEARRSLMTHMVVMIPELAKELNVDPHILAKTQAEYQAYLMMMDEQTDQNDRQRLAIKKKGQKLLREAMLDEQRSFIIDLRDKKTISDATLVRLQQEFDRESLGLHIPGV